jgi:hypothetical protein
MVNAGEYKVELSVTRKADAAIVDYPYAAYTKSVVFNITKQDTVVTPNSGSIETTWTGKAVTFDDFSLSSKTGSLVGVSDSDLIIEYSKTSNFAELFEGEPSDVGVYYVRARFEGSANYRASATTQNVSIRINPVEIPVRITTAKQFNYSEYFDEEGEPIMFTDEEGNEYSFRGIQFELSNSAQAKLANKVKVYYLRGQEYSSTTPPSTIGVFGYQIRATDSNYRVIGTGLTGTIVININTIASEDNSATAEAIGGVLPLVIPDEEKGIGLKLDSTTYGASSDEFKNFNIPASQDKNFTMTQLTRIQLYRTSINKNTEEEELTAMAPVTDYIKVTMKVNAYNKGQKIVRIDYDEKGNTSLVQMNAAYDEATKSYIFETDRLGYFAVLDPASSIDATMLIGIAVGGVLFVLALVTVLIAIKSRNQKILFQRELAHAGGAPATKASKKGVAEDTVTTGESESEPVTDEFDEDYENEYDEFED